MSQMKLILSGWSGSQKILPASLYLIGKYLGDMFEVIPICNDGDVEGWSRSVWEYLSTLEDELIILGMDDMLLSGLIDKKQYEALFSKMQDPIVCAKLCTSDFHKPEEYEMLDDTIMQLLPNAEFSAVGQYCLWNREFLIDLLGKTTNAWHFEGEGSRILNATGKKVIGTQIPTIPYPDRSAMSRNWLGKIKVVGNPKEDIAELLEFGLLRKEDLLYE